MDRSSTVTRKNSTSRRVPNTQNDIKINIIEQPYEKGKLFEFMIKAVLDKQGYGNFEGRVQRPGTELDLICTNNVTNRKIVVEVKAHTKPISTPELRKFHSKITTLQREGIESGIFWSLSKISSHAKSWHDSLPDDIKKSLVIKGGNDFYNLLQDAAVVAPQNIINDKLNPLIKKDYFNQELVYCKYDWYYIQFFGNSNAIHSFAVLGAQGEIVDNFTCCDIRNQYTKLRNMKLILLAGRKQILEILLKKEKLTINEITSELKEQQTDIQTTIDVLVEQNLLAIDSSRNEKFMIKQGLETFLAIYNEFKNDVSVFMESSYLRLSITSELMNFIITRFDIDSSQQLINIIKKLIVISPSALEYCLKTSDVPIQKSCDQVKPKTAQINNLNISHLATQLCILTLSDMFQRKIVYDLENIKAIQTKINLKFATIDNLYLNINTKSIIMLMRASGPIAKGDVVVPTSPNGFVEMSLLYHSLGETKLAAQMLQEVLLNNNTDDEGWKKPAYINLGLFYTELKKFEDAKTYLLQAVQRYPDELTGWLGLGNVYLFMGNIVDAEKIFLEALKKDPAHLQIQYGLCKVLSMKGEVKQSAFILESILRKDRRFITLIKKDKELKTLRKSRYYHSLLKFNP